MIPDRKEFIEKQKFDAIARVYATETDEQPAAGPWQPMDVKSPEHEDVLVRLNNGDVYIARRLPDNRWVAEISPDHHEQAEGQLEHEMGFREYLKSELLVAWARINWQDEK